MIRELFPSLHPEIARFQIGLPFVDPERHCFEHGPRPPNPHRTPSPKAGGSGTGHRISSPEG